MKHQTHDLVQSTPEWHEFRAKHFGASELSAAAGTSNYTTRDDLLKEKSTGISKEISDFTQSLFNKGHEAEAGARPIAERIINDDLSPMVMSLEVDGIPLSASLDGINFDGDTIFEHKLISDKLIAQIESGNLDEHYKMQMDQQLLVSGANQCLFMASDGTENNMRHCWYTTTSERINAVVAIWKQFAIDLEDFKIDEYMHRIAEKPKAEAIKALPSVFVQATGMVTASNLSEFAEAATTFIAAIKTELTTDQDFADAESTVKFCKEAEVNLEATKASVLAQMTTVDEVTRTLDHIAAQLRYKRLMLDKLVKSEKESRKLAIVSKASSEYTAHIEALEAEIKPIRLNVNRPNFGEAIKGLKSLASMQEKVDTALRDSKFSAEQLAKDIRAKLTWCKESSAGFGFLFADLSSLISDSGMEAFQAIVTGRIAKHKADETAKLEAERAKMESEAKEKAEREAAAKLAQEESRIRAEERAKADAESTIKAEEDRKALILREAEDAKAKAIRDSEESNIKAERDKLEAERRAAEEIARKEFEESNANRIAVNARQEESRRKADEAVLQEAIKKGTVAWANVPANFVDDLRGSHSPSNFDNWWENEGSGMHPLPNEDAEDHVRRVSRIAWENGATVRG